MVLGTVQLQVGAHVDARGERFRRQRGERGVMAPARLAHDDLHIRERDVGPVGHLVAPDERCLVDREARLAEQPLDEAVVARARLVERLVREIDEAVLAAAQRERRTLEIDVVEAHLPDEERPPRKSDIGALDRERRAAAAIGDAQSFEREGWAQPAPAAADSAHRNRGAGGLLDGGDDVLSIAVDRRQRDIAQPQHQRGENDDEEGRAAQGEADKDAR